MFQSFVTMCSMCDIYGKPSSRRLHYLSLFLFLFSSALFFVGDAVISTHFYVIDVLIIASTLLSSRIYVYIYEWVLSTSNTHYHTDEMLLQHPSLDDEDDDQYIIYESMFFTNMFASIFSLTFISLSMELDDAYVYIQSYPSSSALFILRSLMMYLSAALLIYITRHHHANSGSMMMMMSKVVMILSSFIMFEKSFSMYYIYGMTVFVLAAVLQSLSRRKSMKDVHTDDDDDDRDIVGINGSKELTSIVVTSSCPSTDFSDLNTNTDLSMLSSTADGLRRHSI